MKYNIYSLAFLLLVTLAVNSQPAVTGVLVPQYMSDTTKGSGQGPRTPFVFRAKLTGLIANATYRYETKAVSLFYMNGAAPAFDGPIATGAGNPIYIHQTGPFTYTSNPSFSILGGYDSLQASASGEYEGWFAFETTGNARFAPGNYIHPRIIINNGVTGNSTNLTYLTITDSARTLSYGSTSTQASGIWAKSGAQEKHFAVLWDNINGTGRPLSCAIIENDDISFRNASSPGNYPLFYRNNVDSVSGAWGTLIPNSNANGVRRIENRNLSNGAVFHSNTDANGVWPTGNISTVNPSAGYNAITIDSIDAPLYPDPTFSFTKSNYAINENIASLPVQIRQSFASKTSKSITLSLKAGGTATSGSDFVFATSTLTFLPSDTLKTINIAISNDLLIEGNEDFWLRITAIGNGISLGADSVASVQIIDDDFPLPVASFAFAKQTLSEWIGTAAISVKLSSPAPTACSVTVTAISGTATSADYTFATATLSFGIGDSVTSFSLTIADDAIQEAPEEFILQLSAPVALTLGVMRDTITISDNDFPRWTLAQITQVNPVTGIADSLGKKYDEVGVVYGINYRPAGLQFVLRDNTGGVTVFRSNGNVGYSVKEGDSIRVLGAIAQFNGLTELIADTLLLIGTNKIIKTPTIINKLTESNENDLVRINAVQFNVPITAWPTVASNISVHNATDTMVIRLQAANADILGTAAPLGTFDIIGLGSQFDNSNPYTSGYQLFPRFSSDIIPTAPPALVTVDTSAVIVNENAGTVSFKLKISNVNGMATIVNMGQTGTAVNGSDYNAPSPIITFPASAVNGDSVIVNYSIIDDTQVESNETVVVGISAGFNAKLIGKTKIITITDNDVLPAKITIDSLPYTISEGGGSVKLRVRISNVNGSAATANISFGGTAIRGVDYTVTPATVNFPATSANGDTIIVTYTIIDDALFEPATEIIVSSFIAGVNAVMNGGNVQVIVIADNDPNGINLNYTNPSLRLYPNPSNGNITISCDETMELVQLTDLCGKVLYHATPESSTTTINNLSAGFFIIRIKMDSGIYTEKIWVK